MTKSTITFGATSVPLASSISHQVSNQERGPTASSARIEAGVTRKRIRQHRVHPWLQGTLVTWASASLSVLHGPGPVVPTCRAFHLHPGSVSIGMHVRDATVYAGGEVSFPKSRFS